MVAVNVNLCTIVGFRKSLRRMPPARKPRAWTPAASLDGQLQLKESRRHGRAQLYVQLVTATSTSQPLWLPCNEPETRLDEVLNRWPSLSKDEIHQDFIAALLGDPAVTTGDDSKISTAVLLLPCPHRVVQELKIIVVVCSQASTLDRVQTRSRQYVVGFRCGLKCSRLERELKAA